MTKIAAFALSMLIAGPVWASEAPVYTAETMERGELWAECRKVQLHAEIGDNELGLYKDAVETTVRSRLRGARIYSGDGWGVLWVFVDVVDAGAFSVRIHYKKPALDIISKEYYLPISYFVGAIGMHGDDASFILSSVSQYTDEFIDEYLRVNAEACE